jgi:hypothetical protein
MAFTPVFGTGFEYGNVPTYSGRFVSSGSVSSGNAHTGTYALGVNTPLGAQYFQYTLESGLSDFALGLWMKKSSFNAGYWELRCYTEDNHTFAFRNNGSTTYDLYIDGVLKASGLQTANLAAYHNIQAWISISDSGFVKMRLDGNDSINLSMDTKFDAGTSGINRVQFYFASGSLLHYFDDFVVGTGGWSGDVRFDALLPISDSAEQDWYKTGLSLQNPPATPTVAAGDAPGLTGDYRYKITFVDADGETLAGTASALVQPSNQSVDLSNIPVGEDGTTARKIYRTAAGGAVFKLVDTIGDNTTTTYNDTVADESLGANEPSNSPHYTEIDERPASTADYLRSATDGDQDICGLSNWDATNKQPIMTTHWLYCIKGTADTQAVKFIDRVGAHERVSETKYPLTSACHIYQVNTTQPDGVSAWTDEALDDLEAGVELEIE